jgi:hypothetical protein
MASWGIAKRSEYSSNSPRPQRDQENPEELRCDHALKTSTRYAPDNCPTPVVTARAQRF